MNLQAIAATTATFLPTVYLESPLELEFFSKTSLIALHKCLGNTKGFEQIRSRFLNKNGMIPTLTKYIKG